jgi:hypothetical protein
MENKNLNFNQLMKGGIYGGIVGGILLGVLMSSTGKIPMIAMMVGSESLVVGWIIHMLISIIFGIGFSLLARMTTTNLYILGVIHGVIIWIIGPLLVMPLMLGMGTNFANALTPDMLMSLMTHIGFSLILSFVVKRTTKTEVKE